MGLKIIFGCFQSLHFMFLSVVDIFVIHGADKSPSEKSNDGSDASDPARDFLSWMIVNTKAKAMELIDKIMKLVNVIFHIEQGEKTADRKAGPFEEKLRASFLLSVVVMLIVVVTRSSKRHDNSNLST